MGGLLASMLGPAVGVNASPPAVVAVIVVLLSRRPLGNGVAFLIGWVLAICVGVGGAFLLVTGLELRAVREPPLWLPVMRGLLGLVLLAGAVVVWRRQQEGVRAMARARTPAEVAAAAPQLPGWMQQVEHFTPLRCGALALALCLLNPVDLSCLIAAALDLRTAEVSAGQAWTAAVLFVVVSASSVALPVLVFVLRRDAARAELERIRAWLEANTGLLTAGILAVVGVLQLTKAF